MPIVHEGFAPYAPTANVTRVIDHYREKAPATITKELLVRLGYPDAYANRTLRALRTFDLIAEDGTPTDTFKELQRASHDEFPARLEQVIRTAYGEIFEVVDPATATDSALDAAFRSYKPQAQRDKMIALFMGLCDAAGMLPADKAPPKRAMRVANGGSTRKGSTAGGVDTRARQSDRKDNTGEAHKADQPEIKREHAETGPEALKSRYIAMLIDKAADSDDEKLLDRIEALLREVE